MEIKNINAGNVNSQGGSVHIGDIIDGLSFLLQDYKEQLKSIKSFLNSFQPRVALKLLDELETRVKDSEVKNVTISSKILFLKALCKSDLLEFNSKEIAKDFIKAYNLNNADDEIRNRACVEYLNINENQKAILLADEILKIDAFNNNAWFSKVLAAKDLKEILEKVPKLVKEDYYFQHSIIYQVIRNIKLNFLEDLSDYNLSLQVEIERYKELTYENKGAWLIGIDLLINKIFNDYPVRYIHGEDFILADNHLVEDCINLLEKFVGKLSKTELKDSIHHQDFFLNYFKYFNTKEDIYYKKITEIYPKLKRPNWFYTFIYCQVLNHKKRFEKTLNILDEFEQLGGEKVSEYFLFKSTVLHLSGNQGLLIPLLDNYLNSIKTIDERNAFNLLNTFLNILHSKVDVKVFIQQVEKILSKDFSTDELKSIFEITSKVRYTSIANEPELLSGLKILIQKNDFDTNYKNLICENLDNLGKTKDALDYLNTYIDKSQVSESLRFYIILLEKQLRNNKESGRGIYKELLKLLKFWRINCKYSDEHLLGIEHNLNLEKNDWKELKEIDYYLHHSFPKNKLYTLFYLICLEKLKSKVEFIEFANTVSENYENERTGIHISRLLLSKEETKVKGAKILYNLSQIVSNTEARKLYFGISNLFRKGFFREFEIVEKGNWVRYSININQIEDVKVEKENGFQKEFIGKKVGDKFSIENNLTSEINVIEILKIYNDELKLHFDIQKEAQNPINDLGFTSFQVPEKVEDFENFLKKKFGAQGSQEKNQIRKLLDDYYNYRIGFSEVSKGVFKESYVDAYRHLTEDPSHSFTTLPNLLTKSLNELDLNQRFILDFSSLILFYNLEVKLGFKYKHKFLISYLVKEHIEEQIIIEKNSPFSPLSVQITQNDIKRYITPNNFKEKRIEYFDSLINWLNNNCEVDLVEEKLDITLNLNNGNIQFDQMMKILVDNMYFSLRENHRIISSDSSLFLFQTKSGFAHNMLNPEKYLLIYHSEKCDTEFYRFLLKSNYIGISISLDTLKNEFFAFIVGNENYYLRCLQNIQYSIHNNPKIINVLTLFLKEVYLIQSITTENKNRYAFEIIKSSFYGMPTTIISEFEKTLKKQFVLLGDNYDEILKSFKDVKHLYKL